MEIGTIDIISACLTITISFVGFFLAAKHFHYYKGSKNVLADRIKLVFLTDGAIYAVTLAFGVWAFVGSYELAIFLHWVRMPILLLNIWASARLYIYYKIISQEKDGK